MRSYINFGSRVGAAQPLTRGHQGKPGDGGDRAGCEGGPLPADMKPQCGETCGGGRAEQSPPALGPSDLVAEDEALTPRGQDPGPGGQEGQGRAS